MKLKRLSAALLCALLLCTGVRAEASGFADVPEDHWAAEAILAMRDAGLLRGVTETRFEPDKALTRAELLTVLVRLCAGGEPEPAGDGAWYDRAVETAVRLGLLDETADRSAAAMNAGVPRGELAVLLIRAATLLGETVPAREAAFTDLTELDDAQLTAVAAAQWMGLLGGYPDGSFAPARTLSRAEAAAVLRRLTDPESRLAPPEAVPFENFVFLGDSLTSNPEFTEKLFSKRGHQVLAAGGASIRQFYGVTRYGVWVGTEEWGGHTVSLVRRSFNAAVVLLGANNLRLDGEQALTELYRPLLEELDEALDQIVFVQAMFPVGRGYRGFPGETPEGRNVSTAAVNAWLRDYCARRAGLCLIDCTAAFTDEEGYLFHGLTDGIHMHPDSYELFYDSIAAALRATGYVA